MDVITPLAQPDAELNVPAAGGEGTGSTSAIPLDVLNAALGKNYTDPNKAVSNLKEIQSFAGKFANYKPHIDSIEARTGGQGNAIKYMEEIAKLQEQPPQQQSQQPPGFDRLAYLEKEVFFTKNPQYATPIAKQMLEAYAGSSGKTYDEIVQQDNFKSAYDKVKVAEEYEKSRSVLSSNPKLGQVTDKMTQAAESLKAGNSVVAGQTATAAVIDAFGLRG